MTSFCYASRPTDESKFHDSFAAMHVLIFISLQYLLLLLYKHFHDFHDYFLRWSFPQTFASYFYSTPSNTQYPCKSFAF